MLRNHGSQTGIGSGPDPPRVYPERTTVNAAECKGLTCETKAGAVKGPRTRLVVHNTAVDNREGRGIGNPRIPAKLVTVT